VADFHRRVTPHAGRTPIIDEEIVNIVKEIFEAVSSLDILEDIFTDLKANSILEFKLELSDYARE
jgi:hypothetical protein